MYGCCTIGGNGGAFADDVEGVLSPLDPLNSVQPATVACVEAS